MQLIHCTRSLIDTIRLKDEELLARPPRFSYLGAWYAGFIPILGRPCVLFTNERTLYSFLVPDGLPSDPASFPAFFRSHFKKNLAAEAISSRGIEAALREYTRIGTAPAFNPNVLMAMNDLIGHGEFRAFFEKYGFGKDVISLNRKINRIAFGSGKHSFPINRLMEMLRQLGGSAGFPPIFTPSRERIKLSRTVP